MTLAEFLASRSRGERSRLARFVGKTPSAICQIASGAVTASASLAIEIEKYTGGAVLAETLHPDADFSWLRGKKRKPTSAS